MFSHNTRHDDESSGSADGPGESEALVKGWRRVLHRKQLLGQNIYRVFGRTFHT